MKHGYVYVISEIPDCGVYKIGYTSRLSTIQTGNHRKLKLIYTVEHSKYKEIETMLHTIFAANLV